MAEPSIKERLNSEEHQRKVAALFSKKFREYLNKKKSSKADVVHKSYTRNYDIRPTLAKDRSPSSAETSASESSKKSGKKIKKKPKEKQICWNYNYTLRNRLTQCSLLKCEEEVTPPEELKPLLVNMTVLLQDLKQTPSGFENLYNLISKITILMTEFVRRPLKKIKEDNKDEQAKNVEKTIEMMMNLLYDYKNEPNLDSDYSIYEMKRIEREIATRDHEIAEGKKQISNERPNYDLKVKDVNQRVRNSFLINEQLKSEIRFNQNQLKKHKKMILEKEWLKYKLENELTHLKKKKSKINESDSETWEKQPDSPEPSLKSESGHRSILSKNKIIKVKKGKGISK